MKKLLLFITIGLFATITFGQDYYTGAIEPDGFVPTVQNPPQLDGDRGLPCLSCSIPEGEGDIQDDQEDIVNGGCNSNPAVFIDVNPGDVYCGRTNTYTYSGSDRRDTDWYRLVLTETKTMYLTGSGDCDLNLFILSESGGCNATVEASVTAPAGVDSQTSFVCGPGTWYFWVGYPNYSGLDNGADYQIVISEGPPPTPWCTNAVPVSNWALAIGLLLISGFIVIRYRTRMV